MDKFEKLLSDKIKDIDIESMVNSLITSLLTTEVRRKISDAVNKNIDNIIKDEIDLVLEGGVETDDGFGKQETYESFDQLFKKIFYEKLSGQYQVKNLVEQSIKRKVDELYQQQSKQILAKITEGFTNFEMKEK